MVIPANCKKKNGHGNSRTLRIKRAATVTHSHCEKENEQVTPAHCKKEKWAKRNWDYSHIDFT